MTQKGIRHLSISILLVGFLTTNAIGQATITTPVFTKSSYAMYAKAQATFKLSATYSNPYDSAVIEVDAQITPPTGSTITVPCFYYVPTTVKGSKATLNTAGATWMLRYTPTQTGIYTVKISAIPAGNTANAYSSSNATFTVTATGSPGFVRVDANNKQFYRFDNGTPYYPVGIDIAWNDGTLAQYYHNYFNLIGSNGITWMRYWLTDFAQQALEWSSGHWSGFYSGLGVYSQQSSAILDSVLDECSTRGIYMQMTLQQHGQFSTTTNPEWANSGSCSGCTGNPYNTANGGFLGSPCDFFTNARAIGQAKKQYRYIVARWGYSPNIFAWELFNEVNSTTDSVGNACATASIASWHNTMSKYFKSRDINQKLVTSSCSNLGNPILTAMDGNATKLDILQFHEYTSTPVENPVLADDITALTSYTKSSLCGEFGVAGNYDSTAAVWADNAGDHVRKSAWIGTMNKVPNMFWYWNGYIDSKNLYKVLTPLNTYLQGSDIVTQTGAAATNLKFASNPIIVGTVLAAPIKSFPSWPCSNSTDPWTATVNPTDGSIPGLNTLCPFLMGNWTGNSQDVRFTVTFQSAGTAYANLVGSSSSGNNSLQIYIDGTLSNTFSVANNASGIFTINVPAGTHTIRFYNNGDDWLQLNNYGFTNVNLLRGVGYGYVGSQYGYGYIYDKSYGAWADIASVTPITTASIKLGGLNAGSYQVDFFDPQAGTAFTNVTTYTTSDSLTITIPSFKKDIAFRVYPAPVVTRVSDLSLSGNGNNVSTFSVAPNPFLSSTTILMKMPEGAYTKVVVYDQTGRQVALLADNWLDAGDNTVEFAKNGLPSGIYFCQITSGLNRTTLKIIAE